MSENELGISLHVQNIEPLTPKKKENSPGKLKDDDKTLAF